MAELETTTSGGYLLVLAVLLPVAGDHPLLHDRRP